MRLEGHDPHAPPGAYCEGVLWRDHERRCELWIVDGTPHLRLYDAERLLTDERALEGALIAQALALRTWNPDRHRPLLFRRR